MKTDHSFPELIKFAPDIRAGKTMVLVASNETDATYCEQGTEMIPYGHRLWSPDHAWQVTAKRFAELLQDGSLRVAS